MNQSLMMIINILNLIFLVLAFPVLGWSCFTLFKHVKDERDGKKKFADMAPIRAIEKKLNKGIPLEADFENDIGGYMDPIIPVPGKPIREYEAYYPQNDPSKIMEGDQE